MGGDFNKANLKIVLPSFQQHMQHSSLGRTVTCIKPSPYQPLKNQAMPPYHILEYELRIIQEVPIIRKVRCWTDQSEAMLQSALNDVDWDMFWVSSDDVSVFYGSSHVLYC